MTDAIKNKQTEEDAEFLRQRMELSLEFMRDMCAVSGEFDPEKAERFYGIDVDGVNGSRGWGGSLRLEGDGEVTMVLNSDYNKLLALYLKLKKEASK